MDNPGLVRSVLHLPCLEFSYGLQRDSIHSLALHVLVRNIYSFGCSLEMISSVTNTTFEVPIRATKSEYQEYTCQVQHVHNTHLKGLILEYQISVGTMDDTNRSRTLNTISSVALQQESTKLNLSPRENYINISETIGNKEISNSSNCGNRQKWSSTLLMAVKSLRYIRL